MIIAKNNSDILDYYPNKASVIQTIRKLISSVIMPSWIIQSTEYKQQTNRVS